MSLKIRDYFLMAVGALAIALGLNLFLVPNSIAAGGASGQTADGCHREPGQCIVGIRNGCRCDNAQENGSFG